REVDLRVRGFGHHIAALLASPAKAQMSRGGSAALARALDPAVRASGRGIRLQREPRPLPGEGGRSVPGGTTEGHAVRPRRFLAASLSPHQRFPDLTEDALFAREVRDQVGKLEYILLAPLSARTLNLAEPPHYAARANHPELDPAFMVILGLDHVDQFPEIV